MNNQTVVEPGLVYAQLQWRFNWGSSKITAYEHVHFLNNTLDPWHMFYAGQKAITDWRKEEIYRSLLENRDNFVKLPDPIHFKGIENTGE
jgi:hypothetical protein